VRCLDCDAVYSLPTLIPESNPYAEELAAEYFQLYDSPQKIASGEKLAAYAETVLGGPGRMLELGCGQGGYLVGASHRGWSVCGVEMTEAYARLARSQGIEVECCPVEECRSLDRTYDVVLLAAILEHLYDPMATLRRVRNALRPGGLIFIDVPNESSLATRLGNLYLRARRTDWAVNLSPTFSPYHVVGFSPASLRYALAATGFRAHTLYLTKWNNTLSSKKGVRLLVEHLALNVIYAVGYRIGLGDEIICWAVRE
jgi:SAM-dependent methyltransferase